HHSAGVGQGTRHSPILPRPTGLGRCLVQLQTVLTRTDSWQGAPIVLGPFCWASAQGVGGVPCHHREKKSPKGAWRLPQGRDAPWGYAVRRPIMLADSLMTAKLELRVCEKTAPELRGITRIARTRDPALWDFRATAPYSRALWRPTQSHIALG